MKEQFVVGLSTKEYIRVYDGVNTLGCSRTLEEAETIKAQLKKGKIYKLVEVK